MIFTEPNLVRCVIEAQSVAEAVSPSKLLVQEVAVRMSSSGDPITELKRLGLQLQQVDALEEEVRLNGAVNETDACLRSPMLNRISA